MKRRKFSKEKKLEIIQYAEEHGSTEACRHCLPIAGISITAKAIHQ